MIELIYQETPGIQLRHPTFDMAGVTVIVKREDLNHPFISGNKWWKLKYNIAEATNKGLDTLLTFGGAYSNHVYATAAAAKECGLKSIGIIRGEALSADNPTLKFAASCGMQFEFVDRTQYRLKSSAEFIGAYQQKHPTAFIIPEGGTNDFAIRGVHEFASEHLSKISFDYLILPVGTGGTMAGLIAGLNDRKKILGVSVLKGGDFLKQEITNYLGTNKKEKKNWEILTQYHFGGYAKSTKELVALINKFENECNLPLDPVYTAKAMYALLSEVEQGKFDRGTTIMFLHTGGLQGRDALIKKFGG